MLVSTLLDSRCVPQTEVRSSSLLLSSVTRPLGWSRMGFSTSVFGLVGSTVQSVVVPEFVLSSSDVLRDVTWSVTWVCRRP